MKLRWWDICSGNEWEHVENENLDDELNDNQPRDDVFGPSDVNMNYTT